MNRLGKEHLAGVSEEGDRVRARRERLGMSKSDLAAEAKVNRNTLAAIEAGESFNRTTLAKIERALTVLEEEAGIDSPEPRRAPGGEDLIEFRLSGNFGVDVVVKGPIRDRAELEAAVAHLIREMRGGAPH